MKKYLAALAVSCMALFVAPASAAVDPLVVTDAVTYLEGNVGDNVILIGGVMITLAALAVAVKWIKAAIFG